MKTLLAILLFAAFVNAQTPCGPKPPTGSGNYCTDQIFNWPNNDSPHPDWQVQIGHAFQDNAPPSAKPFHAFSFGYNANHSVNDHAIGFAIETPYISGVGTEQSEFYLWFSGRPGVTANPGQVRPFSVNAHLATNYVETIMRQNAVIFGYQDFSNDWLRITSTPTSGAMTIFGDSRIRFDAGSNRCFIEQIGSGCTFGSGGTNGTVADIARPSGVVRIGSETSTGSNVDILFGGTDGNVGTLRWNKPTARFQIVWAGSPVFEINAQGVLYLNDGTMKPVTVGPVDSGGTGYKILRVMNE